MRFKLSSRLIGTVTAIAMALTTFTAAPAHADDQRAARIAATILGIAVLGAIINDQKKGKKKAQEIYRQPVQNKVHTHRENNNVQHRGYVQPRPLPERVSRKQLPQNCLRSFDTRDGRAHIFGRRCLERNYRAADHLPQDCAVTLRTHDGKRAGYDARCLRRNGYSLARG